MTSYKVITIAKREANKTKPGADKNHSKQRLNQKVIFQKKLKTVLISKVNTVALPLLSFGCSEAAKGKDHYDSSGHQEENVASNGCTTSILIVKILIGMVSKFKGSIQV